VVDAAMRLETLMQRLGAEYERLRDFKRDVKAVLSDFQARDWIRSYRCVRAAGDGELLAIEKVRTPSQARAFERRGTGTALALGPPNAHSRPGSSKALRHRDFPADSASANPSSVNPGLKS